MDKTNETTEATISAAQSEDFVIEDLEERFVQQAGKWECACSSTTCECCTCCFYIF